MMECLESSSHSPFVGGSSYSQTSPRSTDGRAAGPMSALQHQPKPRSLSDPPQVQTTRKLEWVISDDTGGFKDRKTMKKVRRKAMRDYLEKQCYKEAKEPVPQPNDKPAGQRWRLANSHHSNSWDLPPLYRSPMPAGAGFDPFRSLPQASDTRVNVEKLKRNCVIFFHSQGLRKYWTARALRDRLFFLSSMTVTSTHADVMHGRLENPVTLALVGEVYKLLQEEVNANPGHSNDLLLGCVLHVASAGHYNASDELVEPHYNYLQTLIESHGGFQTTTVGRDLMQLILMNAISFSVTREKSPQPSFLAAADLIAQSKQDYALESPIYAPEPELLTVSQSERCSDTLLELLRLTRQMTRLVSPQHGRNGYLASYEDSKANIRAQLLTFQPAASGYHDAANDYIYESCRISSIIFERAMYHSYSFSQAARNTSLVSKLKEALSKTDMDDCWGELAGLLLWVGLIGAAAAKGAPERPWLVAVVMRVSIIHVFDHSEAIIAAMVRMAEVQMAVRSRKSLMNGGLHARGTPCSSSLQLRGSGAPSCLAGMC